MSEILFAIPLHFIRKLRQLLFQARTNISVTNEPIRQRPIDLIITRTTLTKISREMVDKGTQTELPQRKKVKLSEIIEEIAPQGNFLASLEEQEKIHKMSQGRAYFKNERRTMKQQQKEILFLAESTGPSSNSE